METNGGAVKTNGGATVRCAKRQSGRARDEFTDNGGDLESALPRDEILDNVTLYWLTNTAASSARIYLEDAHLPGNAGVVALPVGYSVFPRELYRAPRSWAEACFPRLIYWHELDRGGHFAAWEQPQLFAQELRACFALLRGAARADRGPTR